MPVDSKTSIEDYARKLSTQIDPGEPFILAGLSLGGIMAVEIAKFLQPQMLILFSTIKTRYEMPWYYRLAGKLQLYRLVSSAFLPVLLPFFYWFFGPLDKEGKLLIKAFMKQTDSIFLRWSLKQISRWQNTAVPGHYFHIHGANDKAFPSNLVTVSYTVNNAGHFCVFTHAGVVNNLLLRVLAQD